MLCVAVAYGGKRLLHPEPKTVVVFVHLNGYPCENKYVCIHILNILYIYIEVL